MNDFTKQFKVTFKKFKTAFSMVLLLLLVAAGCASPSNASEAALSKGAGSEDIISTSAVLCEVLDKLNLDLIGVPDTAFALPARYSDTTRIGPPMSPDLEIIKSLGSAIVISPNSLQHDLQPKYEKAGIPAIFVNLMSVEGMLKSIEQLGIRYGRQQEAGILSDEYSSFMKDYNEQIQDQKKPKVLILMGLPGFFMAATDQSYVGSLVKLAGGQNVMVANEALITANTEALYQLDPDIILRTSHAMPEMVQGMFEEEFVTNDIWKHFRAVKEGKVYDLGNERFGMSANLGYQEALNELSEIFYGIK